MKLFCSDLDGTLTDSKYYVSEIGDVIKSFNTKDFDSFSKLQKKGIIVIIITSSNDDCLRKKIEKLSKEKHKRLFIYIGVENKLEKIKFVLKKWNIKWNEVAYVGDWDNDLDVMKKCKYVSCPKDASKNVLKYMNEVEESDKEKYISNKNGGDGVVADFIDFLIE